MSPYLSRPAATSDTAPSSTPRPALILAEGERRAFDALPADAQTLAKAYRSHVQNTPEGEQPTVPAGRELRRDCLASWTRARYAAAMRSLLNSGYYLAERAQDGSWQVRVIVPSAA